MDSARYLATRHQQGTQSLLVTSERNITGVGGVEEKSSLKYFPEPLDVLKGK